MSTKKNFTIEELEKARNDAKANYESLQKEFEKMQKEEEDKKKAKLALEKEKRMEEIEAAQKHLNDLYKAYIEDYGYLKIETNTDDYDWWPSFWRRNFWF